MSKRFSWILPILLIVNFLFADQGGIDTFGHMWTDSRGVTSVNYNWLDVKSATSAVFGPGGFDNETPRQRTLPFSFNFYGIDHQDIYISPNGWISFSLPANSAVTNDTLPSATAPDSIIAPFWDDLKSSTGQSGGIYFGVKGDAPNRKAVIQWEVFDGAATPNVIFFEIVLYEHSNLIKFQYNTVDSNYQTSATPTIGIASDATDGLTYFYGTGSGNVTPYSSILFHNKFLDGLASANIVPDTATAGVNESFNYKFYNISAASPANLGRADRFAVQNPFTSQPSVSQVLINSASSQWTPSSDINSTPSLK